MSLVVMPEINVPQLVQCFTFIAQTPFPYLLEARHGNACVLVLGKSQLTFINSARQKPFRANTRCILLPSFLVPQPATF